MALFIAHTHISSIFHFLCISTVQCESSSADLSEEEMKSIARGCRDFGPEDYPYAHISNHWNCRSNYGVSTCFCRGGVKENEGCRQNVRARASMPICMLFTLFSCARFGCSMAQTVQTPPLYGQEELEQSVTDRERERERDPWYHNFLCCLPHALQEEAC